MSKNDSKLVTKVSSLIEGQVPDFVQSDHPQFVKFLKDYYQFLEAGRLTLEVTVNYIAQETTTSNYIIDETIPPASELCPECGLKNLLLNLRG